MCSPRAARVALLVAVVASCVACSNEDEFRIIREPIAVRALEYTAPLVAAADESVLVRALVGHEDCVLESASMTLRSDSLVISGVATCKFRIQSDPPLTALPRVATPPVGPNPQTFRLAFPQLDPGTYVLCAGTLADTLTVLPSPTPPVEARTAAIGYLFGEGSCTGFSIDTFEMRYEVENLAPPPGSRFTQMYGTFAGDATCDPAQFETRVFVRRIDSWPESTRR